jgi:hypothetical protein
MCCHHRKPREANIFYVLPMAFGTGRINNFNITFLVKIIFEKELMRTERITIDGKSQAL